MTGIPNEEQLKGGTLCYLCRSNAEIEGIEDHQVTCASGCGHYIMTRQVRRELGLIPGTKLGLIYGRRRELVDRLRKLREVDPERTIVIRRHLVVEFVEGGGSEARKY